MEEQRPLKKSKRKKFQDEETNLLPICSVVSILWKIWEGGIKLILSKEPDTNFEEVGRQLVVTFKRKTPIPETREKTREKIILLIRENPKITTKELAEKTGLTAKGVEWNLKSLKDEKKLRRVGGRKEGYWEIMK